MSAEHIWQRRPALLWDANSAATLDFVDYGHGRSTFLRQLPGHPRRRVPRLRSEPGQLHPRRVDVAARRSVELRRVFHHESRHLSDRPKRHTGRLEHARRPACRRFVDPARSAARSRTDLRKAIEDLATWITAGSSIAARAPATRLRSGLGARVDLDLRVLGVDGSQDRAPKSAIASKAASPRRSRARP